MKKQNKKNLRCIWCRSLAREVQSQADPLLALEILGGFALAGGGEFLCASAKLLWREQCYDSVLGHRRLWVTCFSIIWTSISVCMTDLCVFICTYFNMCILWHKHFSWQTQLSCMKFLSITFTNSFLRIKIHVYKGHVTQWCQVSFNMHCTLQRVFLEMGILKDILVS